MFSEKRESVDFRRSGGHNDYISQKILKNHFNCLAQVFQSSFLLFVHIFQSPFLLFSSYAIFILTKTHESSLNLSGKSTHLKH